MSDVKSNMQAAVADGQPRAISGIEAMRGVGSAQAKGFWADAWDRVVARIGAKMALAWISVIAFFAVFAPVIANAHPLLRTNTATGAWDSPLWTNLTSVDLALRGNLRAAVDLLAAEDRGEVRSCATLHATWSAVVACDSSGRNDHRSRRSERMVA